MTLPNDPLANMQREQATGLTDDADPDACCRVACRLGAGTYVTVYVDDSLIPAKVGHSTSRWPHLFADTEEELHAFAHILGLHREWFQPGTHPPASAAC